MTDDPLRPEHVLRDVRRSLFGGGGWDFGAMHPASVPVVTAPLHPPPPPLVPRAPSSVSAMPRAPSSVSAVPRAPSSVSAVPAPKPDPFVPYAVSDLGEIRTPALVLYYKPTCPYCIVFFDVFNKLRSTLTDVHVYAVNVSVHKGVLRTLQPHAQSGVVPHLVVYTRHGVQHAYPAGTVRTEEKLRAFVTNVLQPPLPESQSPAATNQTEGHVVLVVVVFLLSIV